MRCFVAKILPWGTLHNGMEIMVNTSDIDVLRNEIKVVVAEALAEHQSSCPVAMSLVDFKERRDQVATQLHQLLLWKSSMYSNGSGGPPGYIERMNIDHNEKFERLFSALDEIKTVRLRDEGAAAQKALDQASHSKSVSNTRDWLKFVLQFLTFIGGGGMLWLLQVFFHHQ